MRSISLTNGSTIAMVSLQEWDSSSVQPQNTSVKALITQVAPAGENKGARGLGEGSALQQGSVGGAKLLLIAWSHLKLQSDSPMM